MTEHLPGTPGTDSKVESRAENKKSLLAEKGMRRWPFSSQLTAKEKMDKNKSKVRIRITYIATAYVFLGSAYLIYIFLMHEGTISDGMEKALTLFNTTLPIATGIITYWFATRSNAQKNGPQLPEPSPPKPGTKEQQEKSSISSGDQQN